MTDNIDSYIYKMEVDPESFGLLIEHVNTLLTSSDEGNCATSFKVTPRSGPRTLCTATPALLTGSNRSLLGAPNPTSSLQTSTQPTALWYLLYSHLLCEDWAALINLHCNCTLLQHPNTTSVQKLPVSAEPPPVLTGSAAPCSTSGPAHQLASSQVHSLLIARENDLMHNFFSLLPAGHCRSGTQAAAGS
jgi:hypothetical protein